MDELKEGLLFYSLGTQKIDFSKIQNYFNIDTSKPVIASKGFNQALRNVIDKDINFLVKSSKNILVKVNNLLEKNCGELKLNINNENITSAKNDVMKIIDEISDYKQKNKIGIFTSDKKSKKEKLKRMDECVESLKKYVVELISIENEYNKLIQRKNKLGFEENEIEDNKADIEDPLERTINFYMTKDQKN